MKSKKVMAGVIIAILVVIVVIIALVVPKGKPSSAQAQQVSDILEHIDVAFADDVTHTLAYDEKYFDDVTGFRTAGSDAEHKAADYLVEKWKEIGLTDVEKVPVDVEKWQFNEASFKMNDSDVKAKTIVSYASSGTVQRADDPVYKDGILDAEVLYMGNGYKKDYEAYYDKMELEGEDRNVNGKIIIADINQDEEFWITPHYEEAYHQGAAAIVTYSSQYVDPEGIYEDKWDTALQMQDICSEDLIPCVSINRQDGLKFKKEIKKMQKNGAVATASLKVDNEIVSFENGGGTSYNIVGKIPGTGNSGHQIIVAGHYDKYFYGMNDDCAAIGLVAGMAKMMIDSGFEPYYDIYFVAHGAEEWGVSGIETDWAQGSWEMITEGKPEWKETTIALLNYELPAKAGTTGETSGAIRACEETSTIVSSMLEDLALTDLLAQKGTIETRYLSQPASDAICYQFEGGVPCYQVNGYAGKIPEAPSTYHTPYDDETEYSSEAMEYAMSISAALASYIDSSPAMELDYSKRCKQLKKSINEDATWYKEGNIDVDSFIEAVDNLKTASDSQLNKAKKINDEYAAAVEENKDAETLAQIREKGNALNDISLKAYKVLQDEFLCMMEGSTVVLYNEAPSLNLVGLDACIKALKDEDFDAYMENAWTLNTELDYIAYSFSEEVCEEITKTNFPMFTDDPNAVKDNRLYAKAPEPAYTYMACYNLINGNITMAEALQEYEAARAAQIEQLKGAMDKEIQGANTIAELFK